MTFAPKKKTSKSRSNKRTTNWIKLAAKKLKDSVMLNKEKNWLSHFMAEDWTYKWKLVLKPKTKSKNISRI